MAGGVIYLDSDDEITSAAARIRNAEGRRVAVVLPYGSRVATSRINFRLLARDALIHEKRLSIVAPDAATRALAASAGLPVYGTVAEYEASLGTEGAIAATSLDASVTVVPPARDVAAPGPQRRESSPTAASGAALAGAAALGTAGMGAAGAPSASSVGDGHPDDTGVRTGERTVPVRAGSGVASGRPSPGAGGAPLDNAEPSATPPARQAGTRRSGRGIGRGAVFVGLAVLVLAVIVGGVAAYLLLPSATATVTPREETIGPVSMRIAASTAVQEPDIEAGIVPASVVTVDVQASDTFQATGKRVAETRAKGAVQFQNFDPTASNTIAKGAIVRTRDGVRFRTAASVTVPSAKLVGVTIFPAAADVRVTAVDAGPEGNVPANSITQVPAGENDIFLRVTNPSATSGGARDEFPRVTQEDVDKAVQALTTTLQSDFLARVSDPTLVAGDVTVFKETAKLGPPTPSVAPDTLVGKEVESFDLAASASGTVTTVDAAPVKVIAEARLDASVEAGHQLVAGSSEITESPAVVEGETITYPVVATARQIALLDPAQLKAAILGKPVTEARSILESYGDTVLQVWPDWVGTIPTIEARVDVSVAGPVAGEPSGGSAAPSAAPESSP